MRRITPKGLVYTIDLSKIADRENPRTVEAATLNSFIEPVVIEWGDGTSETIPVNTYNHPKHTYSADGDVFTVIIRSATGHLPYINFSGDQGTTPTKNLTVAVVSIDHFYGYRDSATFYANCRNTANLTYVDPRFPCAPFWVTLSNGFTNSGISQQLNSFTFEFLPNITEFSAVFSGCKELTGSMPNFPISAKNIASAFHNCLKITGPIPPIPLSVTGMSYAFYNCPGLTGNFPTIPANVSPYMAYTFYQCGGLTGKMPDIPEGVTTIQNMFYQCQGATDFPEHLPGSLTDVRLAFYNCSGLNVSTKAAPELWDTANYPNITQTDRCFGALTNLSNYADIPAGWK